MELRTQKSLFKLQAILNIPAACTLFLRKEKSDIVVQKRYS